MHFKDGEEGRTDTISFQEIKEGDLAPRLKRLYDSGVPTFHTPFDTLHDQLVKLVNNAEIIKETFKVSL
ncbi:MAG: hypothetical protein V4494_03825 [Chlamydiota bacterium]